ncbi:serine/threonine-protein kinase [Actinophytocola oryzae]|uniref:serine/threonine-protein kinase n=1 Tax=Actinophytocola oryzae TaxID=502181 RepID=UPI001FBA7BFD|nr:serine/threonine-protein kinase [Actinophytocola oryzae]
MTETPGAADDADRPDAEHLVIGRYRLFRRLGTGGMGVVWQGHDERLNRQVAIKKLLLRPDLPPEKAAEAVARCLREGRIAARLHHPNAISVFDVVDEEDVPCLVMEYLPSRSLATVIAEERALAPDKAATVGAQVAAGLAAAHAAGIVHRDITPGNILLGEDGSVKITDFGISWASDDATVTEVGSFAGTPAYLAPEVALGGEPTSASDVFSLGSTLYTAVEGEPPFGVAANTLGLLHAVAGGRINPPRRSGPLTEALTALLEVDPASRPTAREARELLAAVGEVPADLVLPALPIQRSARTQVIRRPAMPVPDPPARSGRSRGALAVAGVFFVAMVAVGAWLLGDHGNLAPAELRVPSNGTGQSDSTQAPVSEVVAPVNNAGDPQRKAQAPTIAPGEPSTAPTSVADTSVTTTTDAPPATSTDNEVPPSGDTPTSETEPPPSTEETESAPASNVVE